MAGLLSTVQPTTTVPNLAGASNPSAAVSMPDTSVPAGAVAPSTTAAPDTVATPANVASVTAPAASTARTITAPETVSGQLNTLLAGDSTYIQSARNAGLATANSRGLLNSSLAAGTAERAAIDAAAPIATSDANIYAAAGQSAQGANQDRTLAGYNSLLGAAQAQQNFGYTTAENQQNIQANTDLQNARLQSTSDLQTQQNAATLAQQTQQQQATSTLQTTLKSMDVNLSLDQMDATSRNAFTTAVTPIMQQTQAAIQAIQTTPDTTMSAEAKATAITDLQANMKAGINTMSTLYNFPVTWGVDSPAQVAAQGGATTQSTAADGTTVPGVAAPAAAPATVTNSGISSRLGGTPGYTSTGKVEH